MKRKRVTVALIGTGLIGASIGLALRARHRQHYVIGYDSNARHAAEARKIGAVNVVARSLADAARQADIIVLSVPLAAALVTLPRLLRIAPQGCLVLDVTGVKSPVHAVARKVRARADFVAGHPMAGSEQRGPQAANAALFEGRPFALCELGNRSGSSALRRARSFVRLIGATPVALTAAQHDREVATTSALPQIVASAVSLASDKLLRGAARLSGPGFDSVTRLANSPEALWADALVANRRNVIPSLRLFEKQVRNFRLAIERSDNKQLAALLRAGAIAHRRLRPR